MIFQGEVQKAPGSLKSLEGLCEYIMFTDDEKTISKLESNDWVNNFQASYDQFEEIIENNSQLYERPKTGSQLYDQDTGQIRRQPPSSHPITQQISEDGRPMTSAKIGDLKNQGSPEKNQVDRYQRPVEAYQKKSKKDSSSAKKKGVTHRRPRPAPPSARSIYIYISHSLSLSFARICPPGQIAKGLQELDSTHSCLLRSLPPFLLLFL